MPARRAGGWSPTLIGSQRSAHDARPSGTVRHRVSPAVTDLASDPRAAPESRRDQETVSPAARRRPVSVRPAPAARRWPLLAVLAVQAVLSLRLIWSNTAFQDEALYLRAGHLEWSQWLHHAPIPDFPAYFSGAPVLYPPLGALADSLGGLAAARALSLGFMLGVTSLLWATTVRLLRHLRCDGAVLAFPRRLAGRPVGRL